MCFIKLVRVNLISVNKFSIHFFGIFFFIGSPYIAAQKAEQVFVGKLKNLYRIDSNLYRSEQPQSDDFSELEKIGIKTIIDLRNRFDDHHELKKTTLNEIHIPISSWKINYLNIVGVLKIIDQSEKPLLVHCLHGSDRTGIVVAAYRIVFCNWPKKEAADEFLDTRFGYHERWFPKIKLLLDSIDESELKQQVLK